MKYEVYWYKFTNVEYQTLGHQINSVSTIFLWLLKIEYRGN